MVAKKNTTKKKSTKRVIKKAAKKTAKKPSSSRTRSRKTTKTVKKVKKTKNVKRVELKTKKNNASPLAFINSLKDEQRKKEAKIVFKMMKDIAKKPAKMWGSTIIGFDTYEYTRSNGAVGEWFIIGFSPRANQLTIYLMPGYDHIPHLLKQLGPHKLGKCCLYIKDLDKVHLPTLKKIIATDYKIMLKKKKK